VDSVFGADVRYPGSCLLRRHIEVGPRVRRGYARSEPGRQAVRLNFRQQTGQTVATVELGRRVSRRPILTAYFQWLLRSELENSVSRDGGLNQPAGDE